MSKDPRSYLQRAEDHRRHGRLKEAIAVCREALQEHPALDAARITLGRALLESGEAAPAAETLGDVFARLPEHHLAGRTLAEAQRRLGDFDGAEATCRALLERYPRDREIEPLLAAVVEEKGVAAGEPAAPQAAPKSTPAPPPRHAPAIAAAVAPVTAQAAAPASIPVAAAPDPEPEYSPEDVEVPMSGRMVNVGQSAAASKAPERRPAAAGSPRSDGDALATNTLAELYVRQGMTDRAVAVYRNMLRVEPGNSAVRRRLAELEGRGDTAGVVVAARPAAPVGLPAPDDVIPASAVAARRVATAAAPMSPAPFPAVSAVSIAPVPGTVAPAPIAVSVAAEAPAPARSMAPADRAVVERLERWLDAIRKAPASGGNP
jgi:pentatricopeptide repeat protein